MTNPVQPAKDDIPSGIITKQLIRDGENPPIPEGWQLFVQHPYGPSSDYLNSFTGLEVKDHYVRYIQKL